MQTSGATQLIVVDGDEIKKIAENLYEQDVCKIIDSFYQNNQLLCELCGEVNNFTFYEIEVDGEKVRKNSNPIKKTHRDIIESKERLGIKFKRASNVLLSIDPNSQTASDVSFSNENRGGFLELTDSALKIYGVVSDTQMRQLFVGKTEKIEFSTAGELIKIDGTHNSMWDGNEVKFKLIQGIDCIGANKIIVNDNYYIDVEPSKTLLQYRNNLLLISTESFGSIGRT